MHARIEHLLSIRDGEPVAAEAMEHLNRCPMCSAELQRLIDARAQLRALPTFEPPVLAWERIQQAASERAEPAPVRRTGLMAAAIAVVTVAIVALLAARGDQHGVEQSAAVNTPEPAAPDDDHVAALVAQSQHLEQILSRLPERPRVERVSTAAAIDTFEQRIQWLDVQLSYAPAENLSEAESRQLWRERVELMDSLVKVRYAEAGSLWF